MTASTKERPSAEADERQASITAVRCFLARREPETSAATFCSSITFQLM